MRVLVHFGEERLCGQVAAEPPMTYEEVIYIDVTFSWWWMVRG